MSKQVFVNGNVNTLPVTAGTTYISLNNCGSAGYNTTLNRRQWPFPAAGTLKNFRAILSAAPGAGNTREVNIQNGSTKVITLSFGEADTDKSDTGAGATIAVKDPICVSIVSTGTPTVCDMKWSAEFVGDVSAQSAYGGGGVTNYTNSAQCFTSLFCGCGDTWSATEANVRHVVEGNFTITALYIKLSGSIATGSILVQIYKNGSAETSSNITISSGSVGEATGLTIDAAPGDTFSLSITPTSTPTQTRVGVGVAMTADVAGHSLMCGTSINDLNASATEYMHLGVGGINTTFSATEADFQGLVGPTGFDLIAGRALIPAAPGASKSWVFRPRDTGADSAALAVTIDGAVEVTDTNTNTESYVNGDLLCISIVPSGTPAGVIDSQWAFVQNIAEAGGGGATYPGADGCGVF